MDTMHISRMLTDEYTVRILSAAFREPVSAYDLCRMYDIPIMRCFSVVKKLASAGLLNVEKIVPQTNGNFRKYYRSSIRSATITIEDGELKLNIDWDHEREPSRGSVDMKEDKLDIVDL